LTENGPLSKTIRELSRKERKRLKGWYSTPGGLNYLGADDSRTAAAVGSEFRSALGSLYQGLTPSERKELEQKFVDLSVAQPPDAIAELIERAKKPDFNGTPLSGASTTEATFIGRGGQELPGHRLRDDPIRVKTLAKVSGTSLIITRTSTGQEKNQEEITVYPAERHAALKDSEAIIGRVIVMRDSKGGVSEVTYIDVLRDPNGETSETPRSQSQKTAPR
jgi:hypothetical protein